jgi:hypothetical protein
LSVSVLAAVGEAFTRPLPLRIWHCGVNPPLYRIKRKRPKLTEWDRLFWIALSEVWALAGEAMTTNAKTIQPKVQAPRPKRGGSFVVGT